MITTNPSIFSSVGALLYFSTMHGTLSSLSSIMGATAHYPLFRGLVEQLSVIAAKFGVCTMAPPQHTPPCNASLKHPGWMHLLNAMEQWMTQ